MQYLESGIVWGIVLLVAGALVVLHALGLELALSTFIGILLLVTGSLVLLRVLRLESASRGMSRTRGGVAAMEYLESGLVWSILLLVVGAVLVLDGLGIELVSDAFWGIVLLVAGVLVLLRAVGGGRR